MSAVSNSAASTAVMAAGIQYQLQAKMMRHALQAGDMVTEQMDAALAAIEQQAVKTTSAGAAKLEHDMVGELIDVLG